MKIDLPDHEVIEVVLKKKMTVAQYLKVYAQSKEKGWEIKAYQINFYTGN